MKFILTTLACLGSLLSLVQADATDNPALIPASKLEQDFYNWEERHAEILKIKANVNPEIILLGDSITHLWGGLPQETKGDRGKQSWQELFGSRRVLNCGFGWDRTQNALWRVDHGELDGLTPKLIVLNIGTNNLAGTKNCRACTPDEISAGILAVAQRCQKKCPAAKLVIMGVFPRGKQASDSNRAKVAAINEATAKKIVTLTGVTFLDIGSKFIGADGSISPELMPDALHPSNAGYALWAEALRPLVADVIAK
jgi:lysophospholipase L1-like esterase